MSTNEKRRHPGQGDGAKNESSSKFFLAVPRRLVNLHGLFFHLLPLAGLLTSGVWCDRLALWIPLVDMAVRLLRYAVGGRI